MITRKLISIIFIASTVIYSSYYVVHNAFLSYTGFCFKENRYLSAEEKLRATVENILTKYPPAIIKKSNKIGWSNSAPEHPVYYKNTDEFFSINQNCCELIKIRNIDEGEPVFMERLTGTVSGYARIDYQVRYIEDGVERSALSQNSFAISNCGIPARKWQPGDYFFEFHPSNLAN